MPGPPPRLFLLFVLAGIAGPALAPACSSPASSQPTARHGPVRAPFVAFARDFQAFRTWERIDLPSARNQGLTHVAGKRREYVNQRPLPGATEFPVGTILVKELVGGAIQVGTLGGLTLPPAMGSDEQARPPPTRSGHGLFAMVKRGGDFNRAGARGWEWFELGEREGDGSVGIVWRGLNAPDGEGYGSGDPLGGCNGCHDVSAANDYVRGAVLLSESLRSSVGFR
jgi:hypothetical protein